MEKEVKKRSKPLIPKAYLWGVASKLYNTNATQTIFFNTLKDLWVKAFNCGLHWQISSSKIFRDNMDAHLKESFDSIKDQIDDEIHSKS
jgi:hypothetical protein